MIKMVCDMRILGKVMQIYENHLPSPSIRKGNILIAAQLGPSHSLPIHRGMRLELWRSKKI
jgi:hypothetical protein